MDIFISIISMYLLSQGVDIPKSHWEGVNKVIFVDEETYDGYYSGNGNSGTITISNFGGVHSIVHELGHHACAQNKYRKDIFGQGDTRESFVSDYAMRNAFEDCAETYAYFYLYDTCILRNTRKKENQDVHKKCAQIRRWNLN
jgi:hypothetical protein